jgi:hypothetical protein
MVALNDAKKDKNSSLLIGNNQRGWMLSPNGLKWIVALSQAGELTEFNFNDLIPKIFSSLISEKEMLIQTNAYNLYVNNKKGEITIKDFYEFTRTNEYFKAKAKERRYVIIENAIINQPELTAIWQYLLEHFVEETNNNDK